MKLTLVLGGARSGKSAFAEKLAIASGKQVIYIATARAGDDEMQSRIDHHRQRRPDNWITIEEPLALGDTLLAQSSPDRVLVVDCLTLWLTNLLFSTASEFPEVGVISLPSLFHEQHAKFLQALEQLDSNIILVSNEVGMGIVPYGAVSRCFADEAGRLNQAVASRCNRVFFVAAGLPLTLKDDGC